jgi:hypothetical protein
VGQEPGDEGKSGVSIVLSYTSLELAHQRAVIVRAKGRPPQSDDPRPGATILSHCM